MASEPYYAAALLAALMAAIAHTLIMAGSRRAMSLPWYRVHLELRVFVGYAMLVVASLLALWAYRVLPLKTAVAIVPVQQIAILLLARVVFQERLNLVQAIGGATIVCGMVIFNLP